MFMNTSNVLRHTYVTLGGFGGTSARRPFLPLLGAQGSQDIRSSCHVGVSRAAGGTSEVDGKAGRLL
jgi:hypothetical protein